eukprot:CAMPEP_0196573520 /NCGR_PEP_ID=MMETSP1081-20130531/3416_1 /TAXON_ID=36882 /ORGANISM="Pyramimonas amylifera, Strain CCMP720" /LENGTH=161 /DNA_ID=CAMNT_0041891259 /DNA_START=48 /DNA_END=533 /DNA_ORIENTATION=-
MSCARPRSCSNLEQHKSLIEFSFKSRKERIVQLHTISKPFKPIKNEIGFVSSSFSSSKGRFSRHLTRAGDGENSTEAMNPNVAFMVAEMGPWIKSSEDAEKCLKFLLEKEQLVFKLEKAERVIQGLKEDHHDRYRDRVPFNLPKSWPGMLMIFQRCSEKAS